ncbi:MAG TPA: EI24 domain-containing protein [Gemmatimonadales bacterium]|nr:EI24 domain-containing protein [Gemmatimonadales bacterium]
MIRPIAAFGRGFLLHAEALRLLARDRSLRRLALLPLLLSIAALLLAGIAIVAYAGELEAWISSWWLGVGSAEGGSGSWLVQALAALATLLVFLLVAGAGLVLAFLLAGVIAAPVHEALSQRVEAVVAGAGSAGTGGGLGRMLAEGGRAMIEELKRTLFFLGVSAAIALAGVVVPGGQLLAPPALALFTMLFLPLDYASYALDRRGVGFRGKRRWVLAHRATMLGYGAGAFATLLVPGLNFLAMPVLVVSGTLLAVRHGPQAAAPSSRAQGR